MKRPHEMGYAPPFQFGAKLLQHSIFSQVLSIHQKSSNSVSTHSDPITTKSVMIIKTRARKKHRDKALLKYIIPIL